MILNLKKTTTKILILILFIRFIFAFYILQFYRDIYFVMWDPTCNDIEVL